MPLVDFVRFVEHPDVRAWLESGSDLERYTRGIGLTAVSEDFLTDRMGVPLHLQIAMKRLVASNPASSIDDLSSISFYSLCRGLFLPLSQMHTEKAGYLFGLQVEDALDTRGREALVERFLGASVGLSLVDKLAALLGDPFRGRPSTFRRDSLLRLLLSRELATRRELLDRLTHVGDVAVLFAQSRRALKAEPALTAAEVLAALRFLPEADLERALKFEILRTLLDRMGKLEAYFLAKLVLRAAGFGFDYEGAMLARALGRQFGVSDEAISHAMALTDAFRVVEVLERDGAAGLRAIELKPLVPVRPALASGTTKDIATYPVWVERKYDGIRFMLHKSTDAVGSVLCGAYTRTRRDWLEMVPGLAATIRMIPARTAIVDGELYGTVLDVEGARPATVYEVYGALQGERKRPVNLKFAAFDLVYLEGRDLTSLPLKARRQHLVRLLGPLAGLPVAVPLEVAEGQLAASADDVNRLYQHFRSQGYEGLVTKDLQRPYQLATRDPSWLKRKPEITVDLVLLAGVFAVNSKTKTGLFGSYVLGARGPEGAFLDVGDVAGVDTVRDAQIQAEIMREGLITGRRVERKSSSGVRPGIELRPHLVVTVRFEGVLRDPITGEWKLRDPKLVAIRTDKSAMEADSTKELEEVYLRQRMG